MITMPEGSIKVLEAQQIEKALDRMAEAITAHFSGREVLMLTVLNGGMIPAAQLALRLNLPLEMDYLHATRYRGEQGEGLSWVVRPRADIAGRHVLVVDDILDEGPTLHAIAEYCSERGAASVATAVLVDKKHDRRMPDLEADFVGEYIEDHYVFGYGMDYRGGLRHLPEIWRLP